MPRRRRRPPKCCRCSGPQQNCTNCKCIREGRPCVNCSKGASCRNPLNQHQGENRDAGPRGEPLRQENDVRREEEEREEPPIQVVARDEGGQEEEPRGQEENQQIQWMGLEGAAAKKWVEDAYQEVVCWSAFNLFDPPMCAATRSMIIEMTTLLNNFNVGSTLDPLVFQILFLMPQLLCQKTHEKAKISENIAALRRRMTMWQRGNINELLSEARALQERRRVHPNRLNHPEDTARKFGNKMRAGKVSTAIRSLSEEDTNGVLQISQDTLRLLANKHPPASDQEGILLGGDATPPNAVIFERITGDLVWKKAMKTRGGAGPSGMNADGWRILLSTAKFKDAARSLRNAIATLIRKLATSPCDHIQALTANRLVPFKKLPDGCRPIGIGEVLRRIIGKCIMEVVKEDVKVAVGNLQVCAGQRAGGEAAIHAMRTIYNQQDCEGVLLVDATNAFNSLNRKATINNMKFQCPSLAQFAENTYKEPTNLYIATRNKRHEAKMQAAEGTTQGDPIAMAMYALGLSVLLNEIDCQTTEIKQVAYADDLTGAGKIDKLKAWWDLIIMRGPQVGYHPNARKSCLIVKTEHYERAVDVFSETDVVITKEGQRHLGAALGTESFKRQFVKEKVEEWVKEIRNLSDIAKTEPHAAYTAFTHGVKHRWNYLMRTIPDISELLEPLESAIKDTFIPTLLRGQVLNPEERAILSLPPRMGGLGIVNPSEMAATEYQNSIRLTADLTEYIVNQNAEGEIDINQQQEIRRTIEKEREQSQKETLQQLTQQMSSLLQRKLAIAQEVGASNWLTSLPIRAKGFNLNKQEFCDALALRYGWPVEGLPEKCACGAIYDSDHAMICKTGGFVCIRHDEVRDLTVKMLKEVCVEVTTEPTLLRLEEERLGYATANAAPEARVDLSARGFWTRGQRAFGDIRIFDPMAASHIHLPLERAHKKNEDEKIRAYGQRITQVDQGSFTPLVFTTAGGMGPRAKLFYARLAETLAEKKHQPKSYIVAWMRCRLSFSLLRSALLCLRGTRSSSPRRIQVEDMDFEMTVAESRIDTRLLS